MSKRHLLRLLLAVPVLAAPGAAYAQCTKDVDCKGDRVCERGTCVTPAERTQPSPPPPPPEFVAPPPPRPAPRARQAPPSESAWEASARKNVITYDFLSTLDGIFAAADLQARGIDPGLSIFQVGFRYERALTSRFSVGGTLTPNYWSDPVGTVWYYGVTASAKYYIFGEAPAGFWVGGQVGWLPLNLTAGIIPQVGYQWLMDFGLALDAVGGISISTSAAGLFIRLALGAHIGWNF